VLPPGCPRLAQRDRPRVSAQKLKQSPCRGHHRMQGHKTSVQWTHGQPKNCCNSGFRRNYRSSNITNQQMTMASHRAKNLTTYERWVLMIKIRSFGSLAKSPLIILSICWSSTTSAVFETITQQGPVQQFHLMSRFSDTSFLA